MYLGKFDALLSILLISANPLNVWAQTNDIDAVHDVSSSLNQFALNLLAQTTEEAGESLNLAISPYTLWSLLTIIAEGANGATASQLEDVLKIPPKSSKEPFRQNYKSLTKYLLQGEDNVKLEISSAIFSVLDQPINRSFQYIAKNFYGVELTPIDFNNLVQAVNFINAYIASVTRKRWVIGGFVGTDDLIDAQVFMISTLYFKGQWKTPFNASATFKDTFLDENGNAKGEVMMMTQTGPFPYSIISNLKAHAVELPYGKGDRMSMIVMLPRKGEPLSQFLKQLANIPFSSILDTLSEAEIQDGDKDVEVYLPKFTIASDLNMNVVLNSMGIRDVFNADTVDLLGIFRHHIYVSRVIQHAKIEVNEEGTAAIGGAGASFSYTSPPPKFYANRDFAYFIVEKVTRSIIFAGKVTNPNTICNTC